MSSYFERKVAVVTGGASGMGAELCRQLGQRGAIVIAADTNAAGAENTAAQVCQAGGQAEGHRLDVTDAAAMATALESVVARHGALDFMFNVAGLLLGGETRDMTREHWERLVNVNIWGVVNGVTCAYPWMIRQRSGHIVNMASNVGLVATPLNVAYCMTKHAVVGMSTALRAEGADLGVRVTTVCPGFVHTPIYENSPMLNVNRERMLAKIPVKMVPADKAVERILRGVARNEDIIIFPLYAQILWWLFRLHPSLLAPVKLRMVREFRHERKEMP